MFAAPGRLSALRLFAGSMIVCTLMVGCGSSGYEPPPPAVVTLGVLAATSGPEAALGREAVRGAQLAAELVNQARDDVPLPLAPGLGLPDLAGAELRIQVGDTKSSVDEAQNQTDLLINKYGASAVVAAAGSDVVQAGAAAAERAQVPFVDACSSADFLTELGQGWYFRVGPSDQMLADSVLALLQRQRTGTVAIVGNSTSTTNADAIKQVGDMAKAAKLGVAAELDTSRHRRPDDTVNGVSVAVPDALIAVATVRTEAVFLAKVAGELAAGGIDAPMVGLGLGFGQLSPADGTAPVLRSVGWSAEYVARNPQARAVAAAYEKKFNAKMTEVAAHGFTATMTAAIAINASGNGKPDRVRAALRQLWLPATQTIMPWDGVQFALSGQNMLAGGVVEQRMPAGYRIVFPKEIANATLIWPRREAIDDQTLVSGGEGQP